MEHENIILSMNISEVIGKNRGRWAHALIALTIIMQGAPKLILLEKLKWRSEHEGKRKGEK